MTAQDSAAPRTEAETAAQAADMEDILSSIRDTVEEESAKAEDGVLVLDSADMVDADNAPEKPAGQVEERIDLDAFAETGAVDMQTVDVDKNEVLDSVVGKAANPPVPADLPETEGDAPVENAQTLEEQTAEQITEEVTEQTPPAETPETPATETTAAAAEAEASDNNDDVDVDALLAESTAPTTETEPATATTDDAELDIDALMASDTAAETPTQEAKTEEPAAETEADDVDIDALMAGDAAATAADATTTITETTAEAAEETAEEATEETAPPAPEAIAPEVAAEAVNLPATTTAAGLQVAFPSEVLAEALRPLVKNWVDQNLQGIVERLVKEELERLAAE